MTPQPQWHWQPKKQAAASTTSRDQQDNSRAANGKEATGNWPATAATEPPLARRGCSQLKVVSA